jgi:hypothetical protein
MDKVRQLGPGPRSWIPSQPGARTWDGNIPHPACGFGAIDVEDNPAGRKLGGVFLFAVAEVVD